jgi:carboxymethylenebutenolidase
MRTEMIDYPSNGSSASGFLARPDSDAPVPGIVVIQEWWGLNDHIKDVATRVAAAGFVALAPDLYHGVVTTEPDEARKEAMSLDRARAQKEIDGAASFLKAQPYVMPKQIGVVGFCMGGGLTLWTAAKNHDIGAAVAFYGGGSPEAAEFAGSTAAILNIVGDRDRVLESIRALDSQLGQYVQTHELVVYPDAEHAFFNDSRPHIYKADAAQDAWTRTLAFFRQHLPSP